MVKAGGASWAAEVNLAAFPLTRVYQQSTAETAASIKKKKKRLSRSSFKKISRPYSKDILSVPVPSPSVKTHL